MNTKGTVTAVVSALSLLLAPAAFAGQEMGAEPGMESMQTPQAMPESSAQTATEGQAAETLKASEIIGYSVKNPQGEELGLIEEVVIDPQEGHVAYAVLSFGGFLGMGNKLFAIPWEALTPMPEEKAFSLDVTQEKLENAPGFEKDNWPDMANRQWGTTVHQYYGQDPYWEEESETPSASEYPSGSESPGQEGMEGAESPDPLTEQPPE